MRSRTLVILLGAVVVASGCAPSKVQIVAKPDTSVGMPDCLMNALEKADCTDPGNCGGIINVPQFRDRAGRDLMFRVNTPQAPITRDQAQELVHGLMGNCTEWVPYRRGAASDTFNQSMFAMFDSMRRTYTHDGHTIEVEVRWLHRAPREQDGSAYVFPLVVTINLFETPDQVPLITSLSGPHWRSSSLGP